MLVHEPGLERHHAVLESPAELCGADPEGVGPEDRLVGVELHPTEQARIAHHHPTTVFEHDGEPVPRRHLALARIDESFHRGAPVDEQSPRHAEAKSEVRALVLTVGVENQQLAVTAGPDERHPRQCGGEAAGRRVTADEASVTEHGAFDPSTESPLG